MNRRSVTTRVVLDEISLQYSVGVFDSVTTRFYYDRQAKSISFWGNERMSKTNVHSCHKEKLLLHKSEPIFEVANSWNLERLGNGYSLLHEKRSWMYVTGTVFRLSFFVLRLGEHTRLFRWQRDKFSLAAFLLFFQVRDDSS
jgi:hypothetical protein